MDTKEKEEKLKALKSYLMRGEINDPMSEEEADDFISKLKDPEWHIETEEEIIKDDLKEFQYYQPNDYYDYVFNCINKLDSQEIKEAIKDGIIYEVHKGDFKKAFDNYCDDIRRSFIDNWMPNFPYDKALTEDELDNDLEFELEKIAYGIFGLDDPDVIDFYNDVLLNHDITKVKLDVYDRETLKPDTVDYGCFMLNIQNESLADYDMGEYYNWNYKETFENYWNVDMVSLMYSEKFFNELMDMFDDDGWYYLDDNYPYYISSYYLRDYL